MSIRHAVSIVSLATAALGLAQPALAAPLSPDAFAPRSVKVGYADLNLASEAGQDRLDARIRRAAAIVCGSHASDLAATRADTACRIAATADAEARLATVVAMNDAGRSGAITVAMR